MKFLVDAHLPRRLANQLNEAGFDALHTLDLPSGNRSSDEEIILRADAEARIVVTKDADFTDSHLLRGAPRRFYSSRQETSATKNCFASPQHAPKGSASTPAPLLSGSFRVPD